MKIKLELRPKEIKPEESSCGRYVNQQVTSIVVTSK